jgi:hypothetical protein
MDVGGDVYKKVNSFFYFVIHLLSYGRLSQGSVIRQSKVPLLTSMKEGRDHAASLRYYSFFSLARIDTHQSTPTPMKNVPKPIQNRPKKRAKEVLMSSSFSL